MRVRVRAGPVRRGGSGSAPVQAARRDGARWRLRGWKRDGGGDAGIPTSREDGRVRCRADFPAQPPTFR